MWAYNLLQRTAFLSHQTSMMTIMTITPRRALNTGIFVSRLSHYTTDDEFHEAFSRFGNVKKASLVKDGKTGRPKGFGFVTYESEADAEKAIKGMDGRIFGGRLIFVEAAKS